MSWLSTAVISSVMRHYKLQMLCQTLQQEPWQQDEHTQRTLPKVIQTLLYVLTGCQTMWRNSGIVNTIAYPKELRQIWLFYPIDWKHVLFLHMQSSSLQKTACFFLIWKFKFQLYWFYRISSRTKQFKENTSGWSTMYHCSSKVCNTLKKKKKQLKKYLKVGPVC